MNSSTANALLFASLSGMFAIFGVLLIVMWVLLVIAHWRMFIKAGEAGWKSLIPVYSDYVLFKLMWNTKGFWIFYGCIFGAAILNSMNPTYTITANGQLVQIANPNLLLSGLAMVATFGVMIVHVVLQAKTALAFGKGMAFTLGLVLLPNIFTLILAFGDAKYRGAQN